MKLVSLITAPFRWIGAWIDVRMFIRYEMHLCAALSKAMEKQP